MSTKDPYRRIARGYELVIEPILGPVRGVALEVVPPQPGWQVLDVGCGTGSGIARYAEAGCVAVGSDASPAMLERASRRLGAQAELHLTTDATLPFDGDRFDLVAATMVVHEVPADARRELLEDMARVAKPDGRLVITDFRFGSLRGWKGPTMRTVSSVIERFAGHHAHYQSFKNTGGVPGVIGDGTLDITREKIVAGGNLAVYVVAQKA